MFSIAFSDWFRGKNRGLCEGITVRILSIFGVLPLQTIIELFSKMAAINHRFEKVPFVGYFRNYQSIFGHKRPAD